VSQIIPIENYCFILLNQVKRSLPFFLKANEEKGVWMIKRYFVQLVLSANLIIESRLSSSYIESGPGLFIYEVIIQFLIHTWTMKILAIAISQWCILWTGPALQGLMITLQRDYRYNVNFLAVAEWLNIILRKKWVVIFTFFTNVTTIKVK
jgi:hypothetical protein